MDFNGTSYKQWGTKTTNDRLFLEKSSYPTSPKLLQTDVFSTIAENQTETEAFSLRFSESCIDETQQSLESNPFDDNKIIIIDDSSSSKSTTDFELNQLERNKDINTRKDNFNILESLDDESSFINQNQNTGSKTIANIDSLFKKPNETYGGEIIIEDSDSETEQDNATKTIQENVIEDVTLSEKKKKEILHWLFNNFDSSSSRSSYSQESIISDSRKSHESSGCSSLERLELNFQTPNNRERFLKPNNITKSNNSIRTDLISKCYINATREKNFKNKNFEIPVTDTIPNRKNSKYKTSEASRNKFCEKTLINIDSGQILTPKSKTFDSKTSENKSSDKRQNNNVKEDWKKLAIESKSINCKTGSDKTFQADVNTNSKKATTLEYFNSIIPDNPNSAKKVGSTSRKIIIPESESFDSITTNDNNANDVFSRKNKNCSRRLIIPETQSTDDRLPEMNNFDIIDLSDVEKNSRILSKFDSETPERINFKRIIRDEKISESETIESANINDALKELDINRKIRSPTNNQYNSKAAALKNDDEIRDSSYCSESNKSVDSTVNDCADILENLYGKTWRAKASTLISSAKKKEQSAKGLEEKRTGEKENAILRQSRLNCKSNAISPRVENPVKSAVKFNGVAKKCRNKKQSKDSFINDDSTTESSPDCSYYTALTNPISLENNKPNFRSGTNESKKDPPARGREQPDLEGKQWKRSHQRKISFGSTGSSTSEFDPEDVVLPKSPRRNDKPRQPASRPASSPKAKLAREREAKRSFLASLSASVPPEEGDFRAVAYRIRYGALREELCRVLFQLFNKEVFDDRLPGDLPIEWSVRLRGTAGKCYNKQSIKASHETVRSSRIVLATKILDSADRLRDTLVHEMCHAATWLINNISDGHGRFWRAWANRAAKAFPELPSISRCHNYEIRTKYTYKCTSCGYSLGRHSKSLDLNSKRCGYCHGRFELLVNRLTKSGKVQRRGTKEPSGFALYVKENYQSVKESGSSIKHGEVMKILGKQFSAIKIAQRPDDKAGSGSNAS